MLLALLLLVQATAPTPPAPTKPATHLELNGPGTTAFLEVLKTFRSWSTDAKATDSNPASSVSTVDSIIQSVSTLGKRQASEELVKKNGFEDLEGWQTFGNRLFAAIQQDQIARVVADVKLRLQSATESEKAGLAEHLAALEKANAALNPSRPLSQSEREFVVRNSQSISAIIVSMGQKG